MHQFILNKMKTIALITALFTFSFIQAQQAFTGKGDHKFSVGVNIQNGGNAIQFAFTCERGNNSF